MAQVQGDSNSELYWYDYGRLVREAMPMGIRCDACTALAFYLLKGNVSGSITVIEQDQGNKLPGRLWLPAAFMFGDRSH